MIVSLSPLESLAPELLRIVLIKLPYSSLYQLSQTSRSLHDRISANLDLKYSICGSPNTHTNPVVSTGYPALHHGLQQLVWTLGRTPRVDMGSYDEQVYLTDYITTFRYRRRVCHLCDTSMYHSPVVWTPAKKLTLYITSWVKDETIHLNSERPITVRTLINKLWHHWVEHGVASALGGYLDSIEAVGCDALELVFREKDPVAIEEKKKSRDIALQFKLAREDDARVRKANYEYERRSVMSEIRGIQHAYRCTPAKF